MTNCVLFLPRGLKDRLTPVSSSKDVYSEQSTLRIGDPAVSSSSQIRRRRHSGSAPEATAALEAAMSSGGVTAAASAAGSRLSADGSALRLDPALVAQHRHRSLSDPRTHSRDNGEDGAVFVAISCRYEVGSMPIEAIVT